MHLAAIWNVWDGYELLERSIRQIRPHVEWVVVVFQKESNFGNPINEGLMKTLDRLDDEHLVDLFAEYTRIIKDNRFPHMNEFIKRKIGLNLAKNLSADYWIDLDVDEMYHTNQFYSALRTVENNDYDATACFIQEYHRNPKYQKIALASYMVPFVHKITPTVEYQYNSGYFVPVDPTRRVVGYKNPYLFTPEELTMHHFYLTRKDLRQKFYNSTSYEKLVKERGPDVVENIVTDIENFDINKNLYEWREVENVFRLPNYTS